MHFNLIDILKKIYYAFYEIPKDYVKLEEPWQCHVFTVAYIIMQIAFVWIVIKNLKEVIELKKQNRILKRKIEKHLYGVLKRDKNEDNSGS